MRYSVASNKIPVIILLPLAFVLAVCDSVISMSSLAPLNLPPKRAYSTGMLDETSVVLRAADLSYSVVQKNGRLKHILNKITATFSSGNMYALMGPSGSGKSTLLDLLASRKRGGVWSGNVKVNGSAIPRHFHRYSAYVLQDDLHCSQFSVEETIRFAAWLRLEEYEARDPLFVEGRVDLVLDMVGLKPVRKSVVGDQLSRGISGGQLKRLSIGTEIINLPRVIFLDEPTSGLDSQLASEVMSSIRRLADEGRICIATVHQPSKVMFNAFDSVSLLAEGHLIYSGPPDNAIAHFTNPVIGFMYDSGSYANPADFLIDICSGRVALTGGQMSSSSSSISSMAKLFGYTRALSIDADYGYFRYDEKDGPAEAEADETRLQSLKYYLSELFGIRGIGTSNDSNNRSSVYAVSHVTQFLVLFYRNWLINCRSTADIQSQLLKNVFIALLVGAIFHNQAEVKLPLYIDGVQQSPVNSVNSLLFFGMIYVLIANAEAIPSLISKDRFYRREQAARRYSTGPYWLSHVLGVLPWMTLYHFVFLVPSYILCGYPLEIDYFTYFFLILLAGNLTSYYFATYLAAATSSEVTAFAIFPMTFVFLANFAGYSISINDIPVGWVWAPYISYARWVFEGLMINQWDRAPFNQRPHQSSTVLVSSTTTNTGSDSSTSGSGTDRQGLTVLSHYAFDHFGRIECLLIVTWFAVVSAVAAYFAMRPPASKLIKVSDATVLVGISTWSHRYNKYVEEQIARSKRFASRLVLTGKSSRTTTTSAPGTSGRLYEPCNSSSISSGSKTSTSLFSLLGSQKRQASKGDNDLEAALLGEERGGGAADNSDNDLLEMEGDSRSSRKSRGSTRSKNDDTDISSTPQETAKDVAMATKSNGRGGERGTEAERKKQEVLDGSLPEGINNEEVEEEAESKSEHSESKDVNWFRAHSKAVQLDAVFRSTLDPNESEGAGGLGAEIIFKNISYEVPVGIAGAGRESTSILHRVSGYACTGQLLALMGASGAGKTTLLDILAGRKSTGKISGDIYVNGKKMKSSSSSSSFSSSVSAYVTQDSVHLPELTVRETLGFAASLRLDESMPGIEKQRRVEQMLELLDLTDHADTLVGDEKHRGISGGQRKRMSIAVEIVHLPALLFMDEPTTGLDSARALEIMSFARAFADQDRTVICTIHQPSSQIAELFDNLLLLSNGRMVYFGPFSDAVAFFTASPFEFTVTSDADPDTDTAERGGGRGGGGGTNPAEFLVSVASCSVLSSSGVNISSSHLATYFEETSAYVTMMRNVGNLIDRSSSNSSKGATTGKSTVAMGSSSTALTFIRQLLWLPFVSRNPTRRHPTSTWNQVKVLCYRVLLCTYRNRWPILLTTIRHVAIGLFYGSLFYNMSDSVKPTAYTNRLSLLFFSLNFVIVTHQQAIPSLFDSRLMFYRERSSQCYGALPYWFSLWFLQVPLAAINVLLFSAIIFALTDLQGDDGKFWFFYAVAYASSLTGLFMCQLIAAITPTAQSAFSCFPMAYFVNMAFGGYIVYLPSLAPWLKHWAPSLSFLRFSFQAIALSEFENNEKVPLGSRYMNILGFNDLNRYQCAPVTLVYLVTFALALLFALKFVSFERR